jgi:PAS domain S-box-containing protein
MSKNEYGLLSEREEQVLLLSTKGLTDKEIARKLDLSIATVNTYWVRIRTKLGGANRAELVAAALHKNAEETLTAKELENQRLISEVVRRAEAERALRESQSRLQAIIDGTPVVVFIKDLQGRYTLVNREFESLLGKERREILGKRDFDLFDNDIAEAARAADQKVIETGEPVESEDVFSWEGTQRHFLSVKFALVNSEGTRYAVCGFSREITARIEVEGELRRSEERFRALIEHSTDIVTLLSPDGTILYGSPSTERVLGFRQDEMVGQNAFKFIQREDLPAIKRDFEYLAEKPGNTVNAEYRVKHKDGTFRHVEGHGKNLFEEQAVGAIVLNYRDVTERKLTEKRLASQHMVSQILAESRDFDDAANQLAKVICSSLGFDYGGLWLVRDNASLTYVAGWHNNKAQVAAFARESAELSFTKGEGLPGQIWQEEKALWVSDYQSGDFVRVRQAQEAGLHSAVAFPIVAEGETVGVFECFSVKTAVPDEAFLKILEVIGQQIGQFVKRKEAEEEELRLAKQLTVVHTQLDETMESVEQERRRYQDLFEQAPDGYVVTDLKGRILEANNAALQLFGCEEGDCVGKALRDFVVQDLKNAFTAGFTSLPELNSIHEWELKIRPTDRPVFEASISVTVVRDSKGEPVAHRWLVRDITSRKFVEHELKAANESLERRVRTRTIELEEANLRLQEEVGERKRAEEDLLNSHQFAQNVIECSVDGIMAFDRQCRYTIWNKSMEDMSGINKEDVLGQYAFDLFPFLTDIGEDDYFHRALRGEGVVSKHRPYTIASSGKTGFFDAHYSPLKNDRGEIIGGLAVIRETSDISHPQENAELR